MARFLITFPPELKDEIIESIKETDENARKLNESKRIKIYTFLLNKALGTKVKDPVFNSWKLLNDSQILWEFNVFGEEFLNPEKLLSIAKKRLQKDFGENVSVELYDEKLVKKQIKTKKQK